MTERGTNEDPTPSRGRRSRRELLAGAAGALAVLAAESIASASPAQAGSDGDVVLGVDNQSTSGTTGVASSASPAFHAKCTTTGGTTGVFGEGDGTGVSGTGGYYGVYGTGTFGDGIGVAGFGGSSGVSGVSQSAGGVGVYGNSSSGDGVLGRSGSTPGTGSSKHGVHGVTDAGGYCGVFGEYVGTDNAAAVQGTNMSGKGQGVIGYGATGVWGLPLPAGTGVVASTALDGTGTALHAIGPAKFDLSGVVKIGAGKSSAVVTGVSLRSGSLVLATVQNNVPVFVTSAIPTVSKSKVTINLNGPVPGGQAAKVAWFVVN